jgi:hypothetical protein
MQLKKEEKRRISEDALRGPNFLYYCGGNREIYCCHCSHHFFLLVMVGYKQDAFGSEEGRMMEVDGLLEVGSRTKDLNIWAHFVLECRCGVRF